jgi:RimJ/RimL family protein N-acetyltransferase
VSNPYWPLFDLRLRIDDITLRPTIDADLQPLADLKPRDVELNPVRTRFDRGDLDRGSWTHQAHWQSIGTWRPESWNLGFSVFRDNGLVGVQTLEGDEFARRRTVDSSSWLVEAARGQGVGKAMRLAVLALAFDGLGAELAVTEAWQDNAASLGVSTALGYVDNGWYRHDREAAVGGVDTMTRMRLTRAAFEQRNAGHGVQIDNLEPCLPFFGLTPSWTRPDAG